MTSEEERDLHELSAEIAAVGQSPWQPRTVSRAFASRGQERLVFTLQTWIDLDAARSPLLHGELPANEEECSAAHAAFGLALGAPEEAEVICAVMEREIRAALGAALAMRPEEAVTGEEDDGFGDCAPLLAALVSQLGMGRMEALATPVAQAFILIAAHRRNQGWKVAGVPYAIRDLDPEGLAPASPTNEEVPRA